MQDCRRYHRCGRDVCCCADQATMKLEGPLREAQRQLSELQTECVHVRVGCDDDGRSHDRRGGV